MFINMENDAVVENADEGLVAADVVAEVGDAEVEQAQIDQAVVAIEDAAIEANELEAQEARLAAGVETGEGVSEDTMEGVELAVESHLRRMKMSAGAELRFLSVENFGRTDSKLAQTRLAMEGIGKTLKKIWEKILAAIKSMWAKVLDFFTRATSSVDSVEKAAVNVRNAVSQFGGSTKGDVTSGSVLSAFSIDGKCSMDTVKAIFEGTGYQLEEVLNLPADMENKANQLSNLAKDTSTYKYSVVQEIYADFPGTKAKGVKPTKTNKKSGITTEIRDSKPIYRGQIVRVTLTLPKGIEVDKSKDGKALGTTGTGADFSTNGHVSMELVQQSKSAANKIKALNVSEMNTVLDLVDSTVDQVRKLKKEEPRLGKIRDALTGIADSALKFAEAKADNPNENTQKTKLVNAQVRALTTAMNSIGARLAAGAPTWGLGCAKAGLALVEASMKTAK